MKVLTSVTVRQRDCGPNTFVVLTRFNKNSEMFIQIENIHSRACGIAQENFAFKIDEFMLFCEMFAVCKNVEACNIRIEWYTNCKGGKCGKLIGSKNRLIQLPKEDFEIIFTCSRYFKEVISMFKN